MSERTTAVLVVDDEPSNLRLMRLALEWKGYVVITAEGIDEALRAFNPQVDLLIADVRLKHGTGFELARQLATQKPELKILFTSGAEINLGAATVEHSFLPKPFTIHPFLTAVENALEISHAQASHSGSSGSAIPEPSID